MQSTKISFLAGYHGNVASVNMSSYPYLDHIMLINQISMLILQQWLLYQAKAVC